MEFDSIIKIIALVFGFYMAWNIGANDVSNAMGTSVGSGALTLKRAVILAAILEFCGAYFAGSSVSETLRGGLIETSIFKDQPAILAIGMCAALLGTSLWLHLASYLGLPVSTTHAIVGSIVGFGSVIGGLGCINWSEVSSVAVSWVLSPVMSALISYLIFVLIQRRILFAIKPAESAKKLIPLLSFIFFATFVLSLIFNGLANFHLKITFPKALIIASITGTIASIIGYFIASRIHLSSITEPTTQEEYTPHTSMSLEKAVKHLQRVKISSQGEMRDKVSYLLKEVKTLSEEAKEKTNFLQGSSEYRQVEKIFVYLQILSACFVAFAHGANDVANAIGPIAAVIEIANTKVLIANSAIPTWLLALGGLGIIIGLATWGWRVIQTIGKKITELTPTRGFCAEFGAATTILIASSLGMPISTTHCLVGSVLGIGFAGGIKSINLRTVRDIVLSWIVTLPAAAFSSVAIFYLLKYLLSRYL